MKTKQTTSEKYPRITIRISPYLEKQLRNLAQTERRRFSEYARMVIEDHVRAMKGKATP